MQRRGFLKTAAQSAAAPFLLPLAVRAATLPPPPKAAATEAAPDVAYWERVSAEYDVDRSVTNLENAYWGVMAKPVEAAYVERLRFVNRVNVTYVRDALTSQLYTKEASAVRDQIAGLLGCAPGEVAPEFGSSR